MEFEYADSVVVVVVVVADGDFVDFAAVEQLKDLKFYKQEMKN